MSQHIDHKESLPTGMAGRINPVCDRFESEWLTGPRPRLEDFLPRVAAADRPALLRELLALDLAYRGRHDKQPTATEYRERFPEHPDLIDSVFGVFETPGPAIPPPVGSGTVLQTAASLAAMATRASSFQVPGYEILGVLGEGGMGAVFKGHDPDLGRDLAIKVLLEGHQDHPDAVRRFLEEAQVTSQLQHPGIPPVHEIGRLPDRRPYFTMKLIEGRTLAELLKERESPVHDLPRFLKIFEQICQTLAYAHSRGVIHRDLKPLNVMVGAFGEVQVMDWGLAKVVKGDTVRTVRSERTDLESQAGTVMGTPAYMAPEQACGDVEGLDARCDVFGLGAMLCEILTGAPPYRGKDVREVMRQAARANLADALERLEACRADVELVRLAKACLAVEPDARPHDGGAAAAAMTGYLAGVQERLRQAELAQARAEVEQKAALEKAAAEQERQQLSLTLTQERLRAAERRAKEERKRWRLTVALAATVLAAFAGAGAAALWYQYDRAEANAHLVAEQTQRAANKKRGVMAALQDAMDFAKQAKHVDPAEWIEALHRERSAVERAEDELNRGEGMDELRKSIDAERRNLHAAQDEITLFYYRAAIRDRPNSAVAHHSLGNALDDKGQWDEAITEYKKALQIRPDDASAHNNLGIALGEKGQWNESITEYKKALQIRPDEAGTLNNLGIALGEKGQWDEAIKEFRQALQIQPDNASAHNNLGIALGDKGQWDEAIAEFHQALQIQPDFVGAQNSLALALSKKQ